MRLRTFTAPDIQRAMVMIRETLGDEAVIISTTRDAESKSVSVTAAVDTDDEGYVPDAPEPLRPWADGGYDAIEAPEFPPGGIGQYLAARARHKHRTLHQNLLDGETPAKPPLMSHGAIIENRDLAYILNELEQLLTFHSVPAPLADRILLAARQADVRRHGGDVQAVLEELLAQTYRFTPLRLEQTDAMGRAERIMLVGPPGTGKTLAVAKIAANLVADGLPIQVITIDNKRAGSVEQLRAFTHIMGMETEVADSRSELRQLLRDCPAEVPVVIDSFGTNPYSFAELKELTDFANLHGIEPVLVLAAGGDAQEAADVAQAFRFLGLKRLLITRIDTARRMGALLSAAEACDLALCNVTTSPQVAGGLLPCSAETLSDVLLQHKQED